MSKRMKLGILGTFFALLLLAIGGWKVYDYFREPEPNEITENIMVYTAPKVLKAGHLNQDKWTIAQIYYESEGSKKKYYRNKKEYEDEPGKIILGSTLIATENKKINSFYSLNEESKMDITNYSTENFTITLYKIKKNNEQPKEVKKINIFDFKQFQKQGFKYSCLGFSKEDQYLIVNRLTHGNVEGETFYIDLKDYSLKEEKEVPEEFHYVKPNYKEYIEFQTVGLPSDYVSYLATDNVTVLYGNEKVHFLKKYPEVKEYMEKDKKMILNFSRSSAPEREKLFELLESDD